MQPPVLIDSQAAFDDLMQSLRAQSEIALDTESNSLYAYQEQVCLIQLSTRGKDYLIDPLALPGLEGLGEIMASPQIEKVLHGAEYDIGCLKRDFGYSFQQIFDTRVVARHLGWERTGLADLLQFEFGVEQKKRHQRANWGKRPLSQDLMQYARIDTHYLLPLRDRMAERMNDQDDHWQEVREMFQYLTHIPALEDSGNNDFWSVKESRSLNPKQAAVLRELFLFRERQAKTVDRPPFKVLHDRALLQVAEGLPQNIAQLRALNAASDKLIHRYGDDLIKAVQRGLAKPEIHPPKRKRLDRKVHARNKALKRWRKRQAKQRGIESDLILPKTTMFQIAQEAPRDPQQLQRIMQPLEWRFERYAPAIMDILNKH